MAEDMDFQDSSWFEYRRMILSALERLEGQMATLSAKIDAHDNARSKDIADIRVEIGMLKAKAVVLGVVASIAVTFALNILVTFLKPH